MPVLHHSLRSDGYAEQSRTRSFHSRRCSVESKFVIIIARSGAFLPMRYSLGPVFYCPCALYRASVAALAGSHHARTIRTELAFVDEYGLDG